MRWRLGRSGRKRKTTIFAWEAQHLSTEAKQLSSGKASTLHEAVELCSKALELQSAARIPCKIPC
jgi:hypothetical protein